MSYVTGVNADIDTGTETVWPGGGLWVPPTQARVHAIVSDSANDAAAGTGARTVQIRGYLSTAALSGEVVTLNGTTPVNTTLSYTHIESMVVLTAGSGGVNAGAITATAATDSTVTAHIAAGDNVATGCILYVPSNSTMRIDGVSVSGSLAATADLEARLKVRDARTGLWSTVPLFGTLDAASSSGSLEALDILLPPGTYVRLDVQSSADNQRVVGAVRYSRVS